MSPAGITPEAHKRKLDVQFLGGLAWTAGAKWATQLITWTSLLVVARLLSPADFGVGEMVGFYTALTNVLAEFGIGTAVLHLPELNRKVLAQLHLFSCVLCTLLFGVAAVGAPFVAAFFRSDHTLLFAANNVAFFITGFQAVPMGLLQRDMDYRKLSMVEALMVLVQSVVTVATAWLGWGVWALMAGSTAGKTAAAVLVYIWKPVSFEWPKWKEIEAPIRLGRQIAVGRIAWAAYTQADGIVIGRVLGAPVLGVYRMAMNLASAPAEKISTLIMRTASPLFANVMDDRPLVRRYYLIMAETLSLVVMPVMLGLMIVAPLAVPVVLGRKWQAAVVPLQWLAPFMILRTAGILSEQVLISQKMTRFTMRMSILSFFAMPIAFFMSARVFGTGGVAAAWIMLSPVTIFPLVLGLLRAIHLPAGQYLGTLLPAMAGSAAMCGLLLALIHLVPQVSLSMGTQLVLLIGCGALAYVAVVLGFFRERVLRYLRFLRDVRKT
jgi:O-antigen/teichoic acid export membrane protein